MKNNQRAEAQNLSKDKKSVLKRTLLQNRVWSRNEKENVFDSVDGLLEKIQKTLGHGDQS